MTADEFWNMTPREFYNKLDGFQQHEQQQFQNSWDQTRFIAFCALKEDGKGRIRKPEDLMKFDWDKKGTIMSKSDFKKALPDFQRRLKKLENGE